MKRYWDFEETERAEMSEEDVRRLLDFELMEKGVLKVVAPKLEEVQEISLPKTRVYSVTHDGRYENESVGFLLADAAKAEAFIRLNPKVLIADWETNCKYAKGMVNPKIAPLDVAEEVDVVNVKSRLIENRLREQRNAQQKREYDEAVKKVHEATRGVWEDWRECRKRAEHLKKVAATLEEYKRLTGGNEEMARAFLAKAFPTEDIEAIERSRAQ